MDLLWPEHRRDVDVAELYAAPRRPAPQGRPWVMGVMVQSADGAAAVDGVSGRLGGEPDTAVFAALRGLCDAIVVGAGTARAEDYGPPRRRGDDDPRPAPLMVVVTTSLSLSPDARLFAPGHRPLVVTTETSPADRRRTLDAVADVVTAGRDTVDPHELLGFLRRRGVELVMAEGGPSFNAQLLAADVVDEWCLTIDPVVVGGDAPRIVDGITATPRGFALAHVAVDDGILFVRLVRDRADTSAHAPSEAGSSIR